MKRSDKITTLLADLTNGDTAAADELMPIIYAELRRIAASQLSRERPGHTLQPTELIQETYLRLIQPAKGSWKNRAHFFGAASRSMRQILVDHARRHKALKRGGFLFPVALSDDVMVAPHQSELLIEIDQALTRLAKLSPRQSQIVELRYFSGLSVRETAEVLNMGVTTVKADWALARAWLERELKKSR